MVGVLFKKLLAGLLLIQISSSIPLYASENSLTLADQNIDLENYREKLFTHLEQGLDSSDKEDYSQQLPKNVHAFFSAQGVKIKDIVFVSLMWTQEEDDRENTAYNNGFDNSQSIFSRNLLKTTFDMEYDNLLREYLKVKVLTKAKVKLFFAVAKSPFLPGEVITMSSVTHSGHD